MLHVLQGVGVEQFDSSLTTPLPRFQCDVGTPQCGDPISAQSFNPKGVHFLVTQSAVVQYAELTTTTLGVDKADGPWPGLADLFPITDANGPWIHIALSQDCLTSSQLLQLLCCIGVDLGVSLPILSAGDIDTGRPEFVVNPTIVSQVDNCIASGGVDIDPPTLADLEDRIEVLEECCAENTSDIVVLQADVRSLNTRVTNVENRTTVLETKVADILVQIAVLPALVAEVQTLIQTVNDILNRCCPKQSEQTCFQYQLTPGDEMIVTANQPVWLNLPTRIEDRSVACGSGAIVLPGPLWMANLCKTDDCGSVVCGGNWSLTATVRFRLAQWCAGKKASLYLVACGKKYLMAEQTIATTSAQVVTLHGEFLLPSNPCCSDVHLLVANSDDKITTAHVVEFADFRGCCVG